jgi:hypothetical protein
MATYLSTTFGRITGRVGDVVAYGRNGKQIIRRYVVPRNPRTEKQQAQRRKFAIVQTSLRALRESIAFGYGRKTDFCKAVSHAMSHAVKGFYTHQSIDYSQVQISKGKLPRSFGAQVSLQGDSLTLSWDMMLSQDNADDEVNVVLLNPVSRKAKLIHTGVMRGKGGVTLQLPASAPAGIFHVWMFFSHGAERSDSMYAGVVKYSVEEKRDEVWPGGIHINKQKQDELARLAEAYDDICRQSDNKCRDIPLLELARMALQ